MKRFGKTSLATRYIFLFGVLLLAANVVLGVILLRQSSSVVQSLIRKSMLNLSNTAADLVDGDVLGSLTAEDVGSPGYNAIYNALSAFQSNIDIEYIYAVRKVSDDEFIFTVDPDPVNPGEFGEDVLITDALREAGMGHACVDDAPAQDEWGNFYSSYSPVFDSNGRVSGIIGVDFDSEWYNEQVWKNTIFILIISILFTAVGLTAFFLISSRLRKRFDLLDNELAALSGDVDALTEELLKNSGADEPALAVKQAGANGDEIRRLGLKIHAMHEEMEKYLAYMNAQVNTDALTKVGNTTAYLEKQKELESEIVEGTADFAAVVFDINDLKHINDRFGHALGDRVIRAAGAILGETFGIKNSFRIGGDEFIAIVEGTDQEVLSQKLMAFDSGVARYNDEHSDSEAKLSVSRGHSSFVHGQDHSFRDVFVRADRQMYDNKENYHRDLSGDNPFVPYS